MQKNQLYLVKSGDNGYMEVAETLVSVTGGRVGIGTTAATSTFEVADPDKQLVYMRLRHKSQNGAYGAFTTLKSSGSHLTYGTNFTIQTRESAGGSTIDRFHIDYNGNVGIATNVPAYTLDVTKSVASNYIARFKNTSTTNPFGVLIQVNGSDSAQRALHVIDNASDTLLTVKNDGNVGIGTNDPQSALSIDGHVEATTPVGQYAYRMMKPGYSSSNLGGLFVDSQTGTSLYLTYHSPAGGLSDNGIVGIKLSASGDSYITGGNVGIGTNYPSTKLHVSGGDLSVDGNVAATNIPYAAITPDRAKLSVGGRDDIGASWDEALFKPGTVKKFKTMASRGDGVVFAGGGSEASDAKVFRSLDYGRSGSWQLLHTFGTSGSVDAIACVTGDTVLATVSDPQAPNKIAVARSVDLGATWTTVYENSDYSAGRALNHIGAGVILGTVSHYDNGSGAVIRSADYGQTWTVPLNIASSGALDVMGVGRDRVVASLLGTGTYNSATEMSGVIYRSTNRGASWQVAQTLSGQHAVENFVDCGNGTVLAGGTYGGNYLQAPDPVLYKSLDYGFSFKPVAGTPFPATHPVVCLGYGGNGLVIAANHFWGVNSTKTNIYRSPDYGRTWRADVWNASEAFNDGAFEVPYLGADMFGVAFNSNASNLGFLGRSKPPLVPNTFMGSVGIGTDNPSDALSIHASLPYVKLVDSDVNATGYLKNSNGNLYLQADTSNGRDGSFIRFDVDANQYVTISGSANLPRVGIGTKSPAHALTLFSAGAQSLGLSTAAGDHVKLGHGATPNGNIQIANAAGVNNVYLHSSASSYFLGGNVGIGTASPGELLDLQSSASTFLRINRGTDSSSAGVKLSTTGTEDWRLATKPNAGSTDDFFIGTAWDEPKFCIDTAGNVGIGTVTPDARLEIMSSAQGATVTGLKLTNWLANDNNEGVSLVFGGYDTDLMGSIESRMRDTDARSDLIFSTNSGASETDLGERMRIASNGNVGIGTTAPHHPLHVRNKPANTSNIVANFTDPNDAGAYAGFADDTTTLDVVHPKVYVGASGNQVICGSDFVARIVGMSGVSATDCRVGIGVVAGVTPVGALEVKSTEHGLVVPRMTTTDMNNIVSPTFGEMIYNTTSGRFAGYQPGGWALLS